MADIYDAVCNAAWNNDLAFIEASGMVDAIISPLVRSGGGSHSAPPRCIAMMLRHFAGICTAIPQEGRRLQCTKSVRHSPTRCSNFGSAAPAETAARIASERCPFSENKCFEANPVTPLPPFLWGLPPPWLPHPLCLLVSSPCMPSPTSAACPSCMRRRRGTGVVGRR